MYRMQLHSVYLGRLHMKEIKIYINEQDTGRVSISVDWGDLENGTFKERLTLLSLREQMTGVLKNLPIGKMVGHAQGDSEEEAKMLADLISDVTVEEENDES